MACQELSQTYRFADVVVRVESLHAGVHRLCQAYRCDATPELVVHTTQEDIDFERSRSEATDFTADQEDRALSDGYLETLAVYRQIAEAMPVRDTMLVHGSCVATGGSAYLFCAPSGTGKSTHARLWRELLGERAMMVNDDKPLVRVTGDEARVFGTPWDGKHRLSTNTSVPLRAVCLLQRGETNRIERVDVAKARPALLRHVYRPLNSEVLVSTLELMDKLLGCVDLWRLECNMNIEAARVSFSAMTGGGLP